ncbi:MAG: hypothetical protein AAFV95_04945 [Bacteroidota bacterium]
MNPEKYYDRIEHYLSGNMSEEERTQFDQDSRQNPELQQALDLFQFSQEAIEVEIENDLRSQMKEWQAEDSTSKASPLKVVSLRRRILSIAAAACVLLLLGTVALNHSNNHYTNEALALALYSSPDLSTNRSGSPTATEAYNAAATAFRNGDFSLAISQLSNISDPSNDALYLLGHSYLRNREASKAADLFRQLSQSPDSRINEKGEWHLVLALLELGQDSSERDELLAKIQADPGHSFHAQATQLQDSLNSIWRKFTR